MNVKEIFLFGGTTEGRLLSDFLEAQQIPAIVFVATSYGEALLQRQYRWLTVRCGRLQREDMLRQMAQQQPLAVIDATHPYATAVTENIRQACEIAGIAYYRVLRPREKAAGCQYFASMPDLLQWLQGTEGIVFSTLGSKELCAFQRLPQYEKRLVARVLPNQEALEQCNRLHLQGRQIIAAQGPFSREMNRQMFLDWQAAVLVTKEAGKNGGFAEKIAAAQDCGMEIAVLERPQIERGLLLEEMEQQLVQLVRAQ